MTNSEIHDCIFENYMQYRHGELTLPNNTTMYEAFITAHHSEPIPTTPAICIKIGG